MDAEVVSKHGFKITVYELGNTIRYCLSEKFNPHILNSRDPVFNGSFKECCDYIRRN
jgi:flavin-dependent dehydrogenase